MKIGIDLGGTKTEAILIDNKGKELFRKRIETEKGQVETDFTIFICFWEYCLLFFLYFTN